ncbi:MAG: flagellar hook-length control protein FliK, partial [bacterium]
TTGSVAAGAERGVPPTPAPGARVAAAVRTPEPSGFGGPVEQKQENRIAEVAAGAVAGAVRATPAAPPSQEAARTVFNRIAEEVPLARPGAPRELELSLQTEQLGRVRVRIEQTEGGLVRVELRASSTEAARVLQGGLAEFRHSLDRLRVTVEVPPVAVGLGAGFAGQQQARQQPRFFEREAPPPGRASGGGPSSGGALRAAGGAGLVDVLA